MKIASKKLRDSARGQDCTLRFPGVCNHNPETTVLAHVPCGQRGIGMKGPDMIAVFSCSDCHDQLDSRTRREDIDWRDVLRALAETQLYWLSVGLMSIK